MYTLSKSISVSAIEKGYKAILLSNDTKILLKKIFVLLKSETFLPIDLILLCLDYFSISYEIEICSGNYKECIEKSLDIHISVIIKQNCSIGYEYGYKYFVPKPHRIFENNNTFTLGIENPIHKLTFVNNKLKIELIKFFKLQYMDMGKDLYLINQITGKYANLMSVKNYLKCKNINKKTFFEMINLIESPILEMMLIAYYSDIKAYEILYFDVNISLHEFHEYVKIATYLDKYYFANGCKKY
jgi:hypothetical protein